MPARQTTLARLPWSPGIADARLQHCSRSLSFSGVQQGRELAAAGWVTGWVKGQRGPLPAEAARCCVRPPRGPRCRESLASLTAHVAGRLRHSLRRTGGLRFPARGRSRLGRGGMVGRSAASAREDGVRALGRGLRFAGWTCSRPHEALRPTPSPLSAAPAPSLQRATISPAMSAVGWYWRDMCWRRWPGRPALLLWLRCGCRGSCFGSCRWRLQLDAWTRRRGGRDFEPCGFVIACR